MSIQEACYNILQFHLSQTSEDNIFISTFPPNKRVKIVKSNTKLQELNSTSENVFEDGLFDHYRRRPKNLENISLIEFAAFYTFSKTQKQKVCLY